MYCSKCGREISSDSNFCVYCGSDLPERKKKTQKNSKITWLILMIALMVIIITGLIMYLNRKDGKPREELAKSTGILLPTLGDGKKGYIDEQGNVVIEEEYDEAKPFSKESLAAVKKSDLWGYIDKNGKVIVDFQYYSACSFQGGYAKVSVNDNSFGIIDKKGNVVIKTEYEELGHSFSNNGVIEACVSTEKKEWVLLNKKGEVVKDFSSDVLTEIENFEENGLAQVAVESQGSKKYGYINEQGEVVVPVQYVEISDFSGEGKILAQKDKNILVVVNEQGKEENQIEFGETIENIYGMGTTGIATVVGETKSFFVRDDGNILREETRHDLGTFGDNDLAPIKSEEKYGYINARGELVIQAIYDNAGDFQGNTSAVISIDNKTGIIDENGNYIVEPEYFYHFERNYLTRTGNDFYENGIDNVIKTQRLIRASEFTISDIRKEEDGTAKYLTNSPKEVEIDVEYWNIKDKKSIPGSEHITFESDISYEFTYEQLLEYVDMAKVAGFHIGLEELLNAYEGVIPEEEIEPESEVPPINFNRYYNIKYMFAVGYPDIFIFQGESDSSDGATMPDITGEAELRIWGNCNLYGLTPKDRLTDVIGQIDMGQAQQANYKMIDWDCGEDYCMTVVDYEDVIIHGMTLFYGNMLVSYTMSYPKGQEDYYETLADEMDQSMLEYLKTQGVSKE